MHSLTVILCFIFALPVCAQTRQVAKPPATKQQVKKPSPKSATITSSPKTSPTQPPAGYEVAKFVLPQGPYGSYLNLRYPETTAPRWKPREIVFLPKGSSNVALHKLVTSSDDFPIIGKISMVTDGEKGLTEDQRVELGPGTQWVQIDLQAKFKIHGVLLWHYFAAPNRVYRDVIIRLADDAHFTKNARTVYNNDQDNSSGFGVGKEREFYENERGQWIAFKSEPARYVRLYSRGNSGDAQNQYIEVEVWASPVKEKSVIK